MGIAFIKEASEIDVYDRAKGFDKKEWQDEILDKTIAFIRLPK